MCFLLHQLLSHHEHMEGEVKDVLMKLRQDEKESNQQTLPKSNQEEDEASVETR